MKAFSYLSPILYLRNALDKRDYEHKEIKNGKLIALSHKTHLEHKTKLFIEAAITHEEISLNITALPTQELLCLLR